MGDPGVLIGVRILAENEGGGIVEVRRDEAVCEALREPERVLTLETSETLGDGGRVRTEDSVGVDWTETQRFPRLERRVCGNGGGRKASEDEGDE